MNKKKLLTIGILPLMWVAYFIFEIISGRITDSETFLGNVFLCILFALVGLFIYIFTSRHEKGLQTRTLYITFVVLLFIDQGIKLIIKLFFFNDYYGIFNNFISFNPIINTKGSWLNARFGTGIGFPALIILNLIALIIFIELYRYFKSKGNKNIYSDLAIVFIFTGALCSLIDKIFYGGSLDFIGVSNLFIADLKDVYINLGIFFLILCLYHTGFFRDEEDTTLKDDFNNIKKFILFMKQDFLNIFSKKIT